MKTKTNVFLEKLITIAKSYFSLADLEKLYSGGKEDLKVVLYRLVNQKKICRLIRGYYTLNINNVNWEQFSCEFLQPSYLSLEYALHWHGLIDQIPTELILITTKKSRKFILSNQILEYSHFNSQLFFGYKTEGNFLLAEKEKALLDELYLISLKKRHLSLASIDTSKINKKLFNLWLKKYPIYTQKLAEKLK